MIVGVIDLFLLVLVSLAALGGWRRGLVTSAMSATGWVVGLLVGLWVTRFILDAFDVRPESDVTSALLVAGGGLLLAAVASAALSVLAHRVVRHITWRPAQLLDSGLGAVTMVLAAAIAGWALLSSARPLLSTEATDRVDSSHGWQMLDRSVPESARTAVGQLNEQLETSPFPTVFQKPGAAAPVPVPGEEVTRSPQIDQAEESIIKVRSRSDTCHGISSGSGWVVSKNRIVTNAHVVAGGEQITVQPGGDGAIRKATVVAYDPELDLAILRVPNLNTDPLPRVPHLDRGATAVAAGYPLGGDLHLSPAAVSDEDLMGGRNIYDSAVVHRDIYTLSTTVQPGNSGGPLITQDGRVAGTIFARAEENSTIGFALTDKATDAMLDKAPSFSKRVATGGCLPDREK